MQALRITDKENGHYHVVYIDTEKGVGAISRASNGDDHTHELVYIPARPPRDPSPAIPPQIDPMTGQPMVDPQSGEPMMGQPADPGDPGQEEPLWVVNPGGEDGHTHEIEEYEAKASKSTATEVKEREILSECYSLWKEAMSLEKCSREKGQESERFYKGDQWEDDIKRNMKELDRACLTLNEVAPAIDTLIGYQIEQRTDTKFLPKRDGDQRVADMLNIVYKSIMDECFYSREETKVFKDVVIPGKGVFNVYVDHNDNIQGDIKVERIPYDMVAYGPFEKEDLSDCEYEIRDKMYSLANLKRMFKNKASEIEDSFKRYAGKYPSVKDNGISGTHDDYRHADKVDDVPFVVDGVTLVDVQKKELRLVQCSRKVYMDVTVVFNEEENFFTPLYDWDEKDIILARTLPGFQSITQTKARMRVTRFCGDVVLSDENPADLPIHDFYTVPVFAYRQNGEYWGKVEIAKDPQREINKRRSQFMDTMNRLGASVVYVEQGTFSTPAELENFKKKRSRPGSLFTVNDIGRVPQVQEGANLPAGLIEIMQLDQENLQRLLNIVVAQESANESGALFLEKKKGRITGNQFLFDNLSFAKQKLGKLVLGLIQRYYDAERLYDVLNSQYLRKNFEVGGQSFESYPKEEIIELLESTDILEHDVIVSESSFAPSTRVGIAMTLFDLMAKGAAVPPALPIEFLDIPDDVRKRITDGLQQQSDQTAQSEAETSNTEIKKTLLAKGQYTVAPEEAQKMGLVPTGGGENSLAASPEADNVDSSVPQGDKYANQLASALAGG